ncbi:hypothetical protein TRICI_002519 [Trichomonascus ciferrii]|uniref:Uncharacterized protein n=1 Tax=Trichomonascus ciferrii TaxID=44093 RepID=A0A642V6T3_9ASCO|nr:hypothetical protein TRICI_002519 [Trichomonascus ciferrii]
MDQHSPPKRYPSSQTQTQQQQQQQQHRPAPIRIPGADDPALAASSSPSNASSSPRAALVAGLRSATDRRRSEQQQRLASSPGASQQLHSPYVPSPPPAGVGAHTIQGQMSPPGSPSPAGGDQRLYAALHAKQQELLATSFMLQQQQQRLQAAINANSYYDLPQPPFRPASPSLPVRPSSSASNRGSSLFFPTNANNNNSSNGFDHLQQSPFGASSPKQYQSPPSQQPQGTPFRRGHRKASSLSSTYNVGVIGSGSPAVAGHRAVSGPTGPIGANSRGDYEIPSRQPLGPPPLDELKSKYKDYNFASNR